MVSVALATYNGAKYITAQLASIISQLGANDEIIISDNFSTDATVALINAFNDFRITIIYQKQHFKTSRQNCISNFENALKACTGDIIFLSDQDDIWKEDKVEICTKYLENYDVIVTDCNIIDEKGSITLNSYFAKRNSGSGIIKNLVLNTYIGSCMVFKKQILQIALPFPQKIPMHDILIGLIGDLFYKVHFLPNQLSYYRNHGTNVSATATGKSKFSLLQQIAFRYNTIRYIPLLIVRKLRTKYS